MVLCVRVCVRSYIEHMRWVWQNHFIRPNSFLRIPFQDHRSTRHSSGRSAEVILTTQVSG